MKTDPATLGEGLHYGLSFDAYRDIDAVNASLIKKMDVPAKAKYYSDGGNDIDPDKRADIRGGLIIHAELFEPELFYCKFSVSPKTDRSSNAWRDFKKSTPGKVHIWAEEWDAAQDAIGSIYRTHGDIFSGCRSEVTAVWFDDARGVWMKARLDCHYGDELVLLDVKRTGDASSDAWRRRITDQRHHIQAKLYLEGVEKITGKAHVWLWLTVEDKAPYLSVIRGIETEALEAAKDTIDERVETLKTCIEKDEWPGYPANEKSGLTDWAYKQHHSRTENDNG